MKKNVTNQLCSFFDCQPNLMMESLLTLKSVQEMQSNYGIRCVCECVCVCGGGGVAGW